MYSEGILKYTEKNKTLNLIAKRHMKIRCIHSRMLYSNCSQYLSIPIQNSQSKCYILTEMFTSLTRLFMAKLSRSTKFIISFAVKQRVEQQKSHFLYVMYSHTGRGCVPEISHILPIPNPGVQQANTRDSGTKLQYIK